MWKAAFTGRSERSDSASVAGGSGRRKRSSTKGDSKSRSGSVYADDDGHSSKTIHAHTPTSKTGGLTESALRALGDDGNDGWEDEDKDARSERKSRRGDGERRRRSKSEKLETSRSRSRGPREGTKRRERESDRERSSGGTKTREPGAGNQRTSGTSRAIPAMGSFDQFPGQYDTGGFVSGPPEPRRQAHSMSGGLPSATADSQFPGQNPRTYARPQLGPTRADSFGAAAEYYLDEGQSVHHQPGIRPLTPNLLTNPDLDHGLVAASASAHPAIDSGHGAAAEFFEGKVSPMPFRPDATELTTKPIKNPVKSSASGWVRPPKGGGKISLENTAIIGALGSSAVASGKGKEKISSSSSANTPSRKENGKIPYATTNGVSARPIDTSLARPLRQNSAPITATHSGASYYTAASQQDTAGYYPGTSSQQRSSASNKLPQRSGASASYYDSSSQAQWSSLGGDSAEARPGERPLQHNANAAPYAAGAAAVGLAAYEISQYNRPSSQQHTDSRYFHSGGGSQGPPGPPITPGGGSYMNTGGGGSMGIGMGYPPYHEHRGPIARLKDGLLNLISDPEDVQKMEEYTEYIGVCKHCFDPRSSPYNAPRQHHYHPRSRDSSDNLRRRRSHEKIRRRTSGESLRRSGSAKIDKESRYYTSEDKRRKSSSKADLFTTGMSAAGVAAGASALFNEREDFDDTYSIKSGRRKSSPARRRSRSSSRDRLRTSTYGLVNGKQDLVTVRTRDGRLEKRRIDAKSRSTSRDREGTTFHGVHAGTALGANAATTTTRRHGRGSSPMANGRRHSGSSSEGRNPGLGGTLGYSSSTNGASRRSARGSDRIAPRHDEPTNSGFLGGFFTPAEQLKTEQRGNRERRQKQRGFFSFSNQSSSGSDDGMAFGEGFSSKTSLPLRRRSSGRVKRRSSGEHIAATVAGIGATAAALAAAQRGHRISKRNSRPELGLRRDGRTKSHAGPVHVHGSPGSSNEDGWEDELPSDVDDASSGAESALAFGESRLSSRHSMESVGSNEGLGAWGWRWGGKDKKRRTSSPQEPYHPSGQSQQTSYMGPVGTSLADGASGGHAFDSRGRPLRPESEANSIPSRSTVPMQYVDPRPISDAGSMSSTMPGELERPLFGRPGPGPLQQPKPVTPIKPAFTQNPSLFGDGRPSPRRTQSSPTRNNMADAVLIGGAALATAGIIASAGKRSKEPSNVRFGLTDEQQIKQDRDQRRRDRDQNEDRRRADRTRALKEEAERASREEDARRREEEVRKRREDENRQAAEAELSRMQEAEQQELERQSQERKHHEREDAYNREQARLVESAQEQVRTRRQGEAVAAAAAEEAARSEARQRAENDRQARQRGESEREARRLREAELEAELERTRRDAEMKEKFEEDRAATARRQASQREPIQNGQNEDDQARSTNGWGSAAAGVAAVVTAGAVMSGTEHKRDRKRGQEQDPRSTRGEQPVFAAKQVLPGEVTYGPSPPIMDDDLFDRDFFKRKRSQSEDAKATQIAQKAADKVVADMDAYYQAPKQTQADFFRPKELDQPSRGKTKVADPHGDNEIQVYHTPEAEIGSHFDPSLMEGGPTGKSQHAPYGVPQLNVICPTPPPTERRPLRAKGITPQSPLQSAKTVETDRFSSSSSNRKPKRSSSISWGEDETHIYDAQTPDYLEDRDSHDSYNFPKTTAGLADAAAAIDAHQKNIADPIPETDAVPWQNGDVPSQESRMPGGSEAYPQYSESKAKEMPREAFYSQPLYGSETDFRIPGLPVGVQGSDSVPSARSSVGRERKEPIAVEEKAPHIPGGFDDDDDDEQSPATLTQGATVESEELASNPKLSKKEQKKRDKAAQRVSLAELEPTSTSPALDVVATVEEPAWEPPLTKKEQKKREKAMKRQSNLGSDSMTPAAETTPVSKDTSSEAPAEDSSDYLVSKKGKQKHSKPDKRGSIDDSSPSRADPEYLGEEQVKLPVAYTPPAKSGKQEQKEASSEPKKNSFSDIAASLMAVGGVAAVTAAAADDKERDLTSSTSSKRTKKQKKLRESDRDPSGIESHDPETTDTKTPSNGPSGMPGGWESELKRDNSPEKQWPEVVDPFQYQVKEVAAPDPWTDSAESKKKKKKNKRDSGRFNEPAASSPLRSEWNHENRVSGGLQFEDVPVTDEPASYTNVNAQQNIEAREDLSAAPSQPLDENEETEQHTNTRDADRVGNETVRRVLSEDTIRGMSPEDTVGHASPETDRSRSVASEPVVGSKDGRKPIDHFDDDIRSVAASEPVDLYETAAKRNKRRSNHGDDDAASVVAAKSKREKEETTSSSRKDKDKDKKGGLFGLFSRKSTDTVPLSRTSTRSDDAPSSRSSTREDDEDDGEPRHRRRKHRVSEFGDDDENVKSAVLESSRKHRRDRGEGADEEDTRSVASDARHHHRRDEDDQDVDSRERRHSKVPGDDRSQSRTGSESRHHHRRKTDDEEASHSRSRGDSVSSQRHHHRRRTDETDPDSKDQSFLGSRVEDLPPLPASPPGSPVLATYKSEQDDGIPVSAEPVSPSTICGPEQITSGALPPTAIPVDRAAPPVENAQQPPRFGVDREETGVDDLPMLPVSRPGSPTSLLETPQRPILAGRPTSTTAVPLRFPFGHARHSSEDERRTKSFHSSVAPSSPVSPVSSQKKARPTSSEFRPLYLVERNRRTEDLEDRLPSLPSSKPSSRASSVHGSEDWHSAAEDPASPEGLRDLTVDTGLANQTRAGQDFLDSAETTPKASEFPQTALQKPARQEPQFYTWEDFERDERMHEEPDPETLPSLPASRSSSRLGYSRARSRSRSFEGKQAIPVTAATLEGVAPDPESLPSLPASRPSSRLEYSQNRGRSRSTGGEQAISATASTLEGAALVASQLQENDQNMEQEGHVEGHFVKEYTSDTASSNDLVAEKAGSGTVPDLQQIEHENPGVEKDSDLVTSLLRRTSVKKAKKVKKSKKHDQEEEPRALLEVSGADVSDFMPEDQQVDQVTEPSNATAFIPVSGDTYHLETEAVAATAQSIQESAEAPFIDHLPTEQVEQTENATLESSIPSSDQSLTRKQSRKSKKKQNSVAWDSIGDDKAGWNTTVDLEEGARPALLEGLEPSAGTESQTVGRETASPHDLAQSKPAQVSEEPESFALPISNQPESVQNVDLPPPRKQSKKSKKRQQANTDGQINDELAFGKGPGLGPDTVESPSLSDTRLRGALELPAGGTEDTDAVVHPDHVEDLPLPHAALGSEALPSDRNLGIEQIPNAQAQGLDDSPIISRKKSKKDKKGQKRGSTATDMSPRPAEPVISEACPSAERPSDAARPSPDEVQFANSIEPEDLPLPPALDDELHLDPDSPTTAPEPIVEESARHDLYEDASADDRPKPTNTPASIPDTEHKAEQAASLQANRPDDAEDVDSSMRAVPDTDRNEAADADFPHGSAQGLRGAPKSKKQSKKDRKRTSQTAPEPDNVQGPAPTTAVNPSEPLITASKNPQSVSEASPASVSAADDQVPKEKGTKANNEKVPVLDEPTEFAETHQAEGDPDTTRVDESAMPAVDRSLQDSAASSHRSTDIEAAQDFDGFAVTSKKKKDRKGKKKQSLVAAEVKHESDAKLDIAIDSAGMSQDRLLQDQLVSNEDASDQFRDRKPVSTEEIGELPSSGRDKTSNQKHGFADIAAAVMTGSGIAAVATAITNLGRDKSEETKSEHSSPIPEETTVAIAAEALERPESPELETSVERAVAQQRIETAGRAIVSSSPAHEHNRRDDKGKETESGGEINVGPSGPQLLDVSQSHDLENTNTTERQLSPLTSHVAESEQRDRLADEGFFHDMLPQPTLDSSQPVYQESTQSTPALAFSGGHEISREVHESKMLSAHEFESLPPLPESRPSSPEPTSDEAHDTKLSGARDDLQELRAEPCPAEQGRKDRKTRKQNRKSTADSWSETHAQESSATADPEVRPQDSAPEPTTEIGVAHAVLVVEPAARDEERSELPSKKSKKEKRKSKRSGTTTLPTAVQPSEALVADRENEDRAHSSLAANNEADAASRADESAAVSDVPFERTEPAFVEPAQGASDDWAGFSAKRSKKDKKNGKKSGLSTTVLQKPTSSAMAKDVDAANKREIRSVSDNGQYGGGTRAEELREQPTSAEPLSGPRDLQSEALPVVSVEPALDTGLAGSSPVSQPGNAEHEWTVPNRPLAGRETTGISISQGPPKEGLDNNEQSTIDSHDIEFAATLAAGLADSGFNPDLVLNDPNFHRRASPPGVVAEADPEEVFVLPSKKVKKGTKKRKSADETREPAMAVTASSGTHPAEVMPADEFDAVLTQGLSDSGLDPDLVRQLSPQDGRLSHEPEEGEAESSYSVSRQRSSKTGKRVTANSDETSISNEGRVEPKIYNSSAGPSINAAQQSSRVASHEVAVDDDGGAPFGIQNPTARQNPQPISEPVSSPQEPGADPRMVKDLVAQAITVPTEMFAVADDRDMDVEEMDRAYRAYRKKEKRNKKKLKGGAPATSDLPHPELATVDDLHDENPSQPLSTTTGPSPPGGGTDRADLEPQDSTDSSSTRQKPTALEESTNSSLEPVLSTTSSKVQSVFPGLDRVKRKMASPPSSLVNSDRSRQPSSDARPEGVFHTSEIPQSLPMAVTRSSASKSPDLGRQKHQTSMPPRDPHGAHDEHKSSLSELPALGVAAAAIGVGLFTHNVGAVRPIEARAADAPRSRPHFHSSQPWEDQAILIADAPGLGAEEQDVPRDSGYQESEGLQSQRQSASTAGNDSKDIQASPTRDKIHQRRSQEPLRISTPTGADWDLKISKKRSNSEATLMSARERTTSSETDNTPLEPTTKQRTSYLFQSPPALGQITKAIDIPLTRDPEATIISHSRALAAPGPSAHASTQGESSPRADVDQSAFSPPAAGMLSPRLLNSIPEEHHAPKRGVEGGHNAGPEPKALDRTQTPQSMRQSEVDQPSTGHERSSNNPLSTDELIKRLSWPLVDEESGTVDIDRSLARPPTRRLVTSEHRSPSALSNRSNGSGAHFKSPEEMRSYSRTSNRSSTPTLRRIDRSVSGDLRAASRRGDSTTKTIPFEPPPTPPSNDEEEVMEGSAARGTVMADDLFVNDPHTPTLRHGSDSVEQQGYGDAQRSQASPTRPPSMRKRQSMHVVDLESRLEQLVAENQALQEARHSHEATTYQHDVNGQVLREALDARELTLQARDAEINQIKAMLQPMQDEIARLTETNGGLTESNRNLVDDANGRYATLQTEHANAHQQWQSTSRDLEGLRSEHGRVTAGMKSIVEGEIANALADKNAEILRLREQLDVATEQIRAMQVQIQSSRVGEFLTIRDEDYFDGACQKLCQHVQQWVLRFSKLSDNRVCRLSNELDDDKIEQRLDNAILDGSDVDKLLGDRVRRRDVFMSVVMTMAWEYVFTRYLFGMDREQRQKLKALEKILAEVGPPRAIAQWRATTLTLLSKRPDFGRQCQMDTEAVTHEIFAVLCALLPPPSSSESQLLVSLQKVLAVAVDLSIEMRTQRAEFIMLPPLQPEYDSNGELVRQVHFNASLMNERSGAFNSNEELEQGRAVVKIVLFPLVVKKGDESGEGEEEIVVCPAQVLVHNDGGKGKKVVRVMSGAMDIDDPRKSRQSLISTTGGSVGF